MPLMDQAQADQALGMNLIRQDQYDKMFPPTTVEPAQDIQAVPMQQYQTQAGPEMAPDFIPTGPTSLLSNMAPAFGAGSGAALGGALNLSPETPNERAAAVKAAQAPYLPENQIAAKPLYDDPYLTADKEARDRQAAFDFASKNYPGAAGYDLMAQGIRGQGAAMSELSRNQSLQYQKTMDELENYNKDQSIADIAQKAKADKALADLETMRSDLASTKIEPRNLLADKSTGEKILAWSALILGGIGGHGENFAAKALDRAVERDVDAQKAQYETKRQGYQNKQTLYGQMMDKFKNETAAREAARMGVYKMAELKLAQLGSRYNDAASQAKVNEQLGQLNLLQENAKAKFLDAMMGGDDPYRGLDEKQAARLVPGYGFAPDPKMRDKAVEATSMADNTISNINTILTKAKDTGRFDFGANQELSTLVQRLRSESREAILGPGTVQEAERELINDLIRDPGAFFGNRAKSQKALEIIKDAAARTRDNKLRSFGLRPRSSRFQTMKYE